MAGPLALDRMLISVSGPDARSFLQEVLSQDLNRLADEPALYAALLSPQGKVIADMMLWPEAVGCVLIEADPAPGASLTRRLSMYKLRAQVSLADVSDRFGVIVSEAPFAGAVADPRFPDGALGWRKIAPKAEGYGLADGVAVLNRQRLALGVPDLARDAAPEEVFALEALLEELHGVDFKKGCFVGQENVSRMKRRATTRKKFCPVAFDGPAPAPGTPIRAGESELGTVRTGMPGRALALLRLDRALAAIKLGRRLLANDREIRLDPPSWLILPQREDDDSGEPD